MRVCDQSVRVDLTRVPSGSLSFDVQPQEVLVVRRAAQPRFAKVDRTSQEESIPTRARSALLWDVDVALPPPAPPGCKQVALLSEEATESHGDARVMDAVWSRTLKCSYAGWRHRNRRQCDLIPTPLSKMKWFCC